MQFCSACQKAPATIVIMDLSGGSVTDQQHLCGPCAEKLGIVQPKTPLKLSAEILEDLLSTMHSKGSARGRREDACAGCGMVLQQFKVSGRLGCPRCYDTFRAELVPLLQRVHDASNHRGRLPGRVSPAAPADALVDLRRRLDDAIRGERYEEAAQLRDELRRAEQDDPGEEPPP